MFTGDYLKTSIIFLALVISSISVAGGKELTVERLVVRSPDGKHEIVIGQQRLELKMLGQTERQREATLKQKFGGHHT